MKSLKRTADYFIFNYLFIGCCATAQSLLTYLQLSIPVNWKLVLIISLSTSLVYNACTISLEKINLICSFSSRGLRLLFKSQQIKLICILGFIILFLLAGLKLSTVFVLFVMFILCLFYKLPILGIKYKRITIRQITFLKVFVISSIWVISTVYLPYNEYGKNIEILKLGIIMGMQLLFIAAIALTFDIRDIREDSRNKLNTIPVRIGEKNTKSLCYLFLFCFFLLAFYQQENMNYRLIEPALITVAVTMILVYYSGSSRNKYFYFLLLDGMCLFQYLVILGFTLGRPS